jgi:hypothetical protein
MMCFLLFSFQYAQKKLRVMDQTLSGRSHHGPLDKFAKKNFRVKLEN